LFDHLSSGLLISRRHKGRLVGGKAGGRRGQTDPFAPYNEPRREAALGEALKAGVDTELAIS
jgi:hypothetical protein